MNDGGPAFPSHGTMGEVAHQGMTLRDYFAAKAMQGLLACNWGFDHSTNQDTGPDLYALKAYQVADAMLKQREVQS